MGETDTATVTRWGKVPAWWLTHPGTDIDHFGVMAAMATYADASGICDPSQATLARRLNRSRPWVNRVVAQLAEIGLIEKTVRHRGNGGTTSCEYRLLLVQPGTPDAETPVRGVTGAGHVDDTPCHRYDKNQPELEQNNCPPAPHAQSGDGIHVLGKESLPTGWTPSPAAVAEALALYPDAAVEEHTALFLARCRSKGYRIEPGKADDTWLSWLIEDSRRERVRSRNGTVPAATPKAGPGDRTDRFSAWAASASTRAVPVRATWR